MNKLPPAHTSQTFIILLSTLELVRHYSNKGIFAIRRAVKHFWSRAVARIIENAETRMSSLHTFNISEEKTGKKLI